jgi:hypothetical protein
MNLVSPQDPIFGSQVPVAQKQFLVHGPGDVGQDTCPLHKFAPPPTDPQRAPSIPQNGSGPWATRLRGGEITPCLSCSFHILTIRVERRCTRTNPVGERRDVDVDALPRIGFALAVERLV